MTARLSARLSARFWWKLAYDPAFGDGFGGQLLHFADIVSGLGEFGVEAFVVPPVIAQDVELGNAVEVTAGDGTKLGGDQGFTLAPVGEHGHEVGAVFGIGESNGVGQVIADVEGHPDADAVTGWKVVVAHGDGPLPNAPDDYVLTFTTLDDNPAVVVAVFTQAAGGFKVEFDAVVQVNWQGLELGCKTLDVLALCGGWTVDFLHRGRLRLRDTDARTNYSVNALRFLR